MRRRLDDPLTPPALRRSQCLPGTRVLHRHSQQAAILVCLEEPYVWLQYEVDLHRGLVHSMRVPRDAVILPRSRELPPAGTALAAP